MVTVFLPHGVETRKHLRGTEFRASHKAECFPKIVLVPRSERNELVPNSLSAYGGTAVPGTWLLGGWREYRARRPKGISHPQ